MRRFIAFLFTALVPAAACSRASNESPGDAAPTVAPTPPASSSVAIAAEPPPPPPKCPADMIYVDTTYCAKIQRDCADVEHERSNHLEICHRFKEGPGKCLVPEEHRQFCIDTYEYPNKEGAHPQWMMTWYDAQATCESKGKRLCYDSEWTAACEGPDHTPFPYGYERDHDKCNFDNFFIEVRKDPKYGFVMFSKDKEVADKELARLDQSVNSGALPECKSGFGVHDQTGNVDEWVISDHPPAEKSQWAGLKGGAWGHVRNACRPMTTSHFPHENYYFWGFRCCKDSEGDPAWRPCDKGPSCPVPPPEVEPHDFAPDPLIVTNPAGPSKTKYGANNRKWFEHPPDAGP